APGPRGEWRLGGGAAPRHGGGFVRAGRLHGRRLPVPPRRPRPPAAADRPLSRRRRLPRGPAGSVAPALPVARLQPPRPHPAGDPRPRRRLRPEGVPPRRPGSTAARVGRVLRHYRDAVARPAAPTRRRRGRRPPPAAPARGEQGVAGRGAADARGTAAVLVVARPVRRPRRGDGPPAVGVAGAGT